MSFDLVPIADIEKMAAAVAASKLFGVKTPEEAMAIMLIAQAEGMHPAAAARDYHIIQGRPAMKADAMYARYLNSGGKVEWHEYTDTKVSATFTHPAGGSVKIEWTIEMAKKIGLATKDNWHKYPRQMLRARTISEGVRTTNPSVAVGIYTPEEVQDFDDKPVPTKRRQEKDMGPAEIIEEKISEAQHKRLEALIAEKGIDREAVKEWILKQFGVLHFPDLTKDQYDALDLFLVDFKGNAGGASGTPPQLPSQPEAASAPTITLDMHTEIIDKLHELSVPEDRLKLAANVDSLLKIPQANYQRTLDWIEKFAEKRNGKSR